MSVPFVKKVKTILSLILEPKVLYSLLSLRAWGYLIDTGWFNSFKSGEPLDQDYLPLPWFTYPSIDFLKERLNNELKIFEFGSGNSTLFFLKRVKEIHSAEHVRDWYEKLSKFNIENGEIIFVKSESPSQYLETLRKSNQKFDIIIIDGIYRNECLVESINHLSEFGVIILDDSERKEYIVGIREIENNNYRRLDFWGISPGYLYRKSTSFFYKSNNCLKI